MAAQTEVKADRPATASMRTGAEFLRSLNDGRQVFVDGEKVKDVTAHRAFREAARSIARLFDIAAAPENRERMTFTSPRYRRAGVRALTRFRAACRPARQASPPRSGPSDLRPDGPHAGPCRRLLRRLCRQAAVLRRGRRSVWPTTSSRSTSTCATTHLRRLRDRAAADRPQQAGAQAERSDALCRRGQGDRRGHRHLRRAAARHRRRLCPTTSI